MNPIDAVYNGQFAVERRVHQRRISPDCVAVERCGPLLYQVPGSHILKKHFNSVISSVAIARE